MTEEKPSSWKRIRNLVVAIAGIITFFVGIAALLVELLGALPSEVGDPIWVSLGILQPSPTPTHTLPFTATPTPTETSVFTSTPTNTAIPPTGAPVATATHTPRPTNTSLPTDTPGPMYPCDGRIPGVSGLLNQLHVQPSESSPSRSPVRQGSSIIILREVSDFGDTWYEIEYNDGDDRGWIPEDFVESGNNCPNN